MASARNNPVRGKSNLIARAIYRQMTGGTARSNPRFQKGHGGDLTSMRRPDYDAIHAAAKRGVADWMKQKDKPASARTGIFKKMPKGKRTENLREAIGGSKDGADPNLLAAIHSAVNSEMRIAYGGSRGFQKRQYGAKGGRYRMKTKAGGDPGKAVRVPKKGFIAEHWGRNVPKRKKGESKAAYEKRYRAGVFHGYNTKRTKVRQGISGWDQAARAYEPGYLGEDGLGYWHDPSNPGASGKILLDLEAVTASKRSKRRRKAPSSRSKHGQRLLKSVPGVTAFRKTPEYKGWSKSKKSTFNSTYKGEIATGTSRKESVAIAYAAAERAKNNYGALALDNYGALALDNYGALALDNPLPFVGGVVGDAGKLVLVGLAGALGHAFVADKVEDLIEKVPVIGEKLLDLSVPDAIPLIGGMELDNTISGAVAGIAVIALSQFAGRQLGQPMLTQYGSALGTGIILAGPVLDFAGGSAPAGDEEEEDADVAGLALDNYGALALDNEGTFGDGMAYQLGAIVDDSEVGYGQASLGDAYYSGADFDLGEGQALVNGRSYFRRRYGHPPRRVHRLGGKSGSASHLASKPGHRWGWLIKMIGWQNTQKLAAMPPKQRVSVIKKLREQALATFKQIQVEAQEQLLAAPELASQAPDGVGGVFGAYGATVFGGAGL